MPSKASTLFCHSLLGAVASQRIDLSIYYAFASDIAISGFTSLNGLICLHSVLDKAGSQSVFKRT